MAAGSMVPALKYFAIVLRTPVARVGKRVAYTRPQIIVGLLVLGLRGILGGAMIARLPIDPITVCACGSQPRF
ncbi:hypothetical protein DUT91_21405 [Phyllobacterium salinisoli]|uniref:Uncharacterized protein n=1 Tax=Phyllobacterium salinisoli TaxID=1899321 RepID=A0A368JXG0_9HYPH|nr:hypothetical protein [Phyllobacterium salinisoli]RCS21848.1 hypothetical protein DUT91_21405 [Phyllobacterium salinisoli]